MKEGFVRSVRGATFGATQAEASARTHAVDGLVARLVTQSVMGKQLIDAAGLRHAWDFMGECPS